MSEGPDEHSVTVSYSAADIAAMNLVVWPFWVSLLAIMAAAVIGAPLLLSIARGSPPSDAIAEIDWRFTGWLLLILLAWLMFVTVLTYWMRRRRGLHGPMQLSLNDDGLAFRNRQMNGLVFWGSIKSVSATRARIFFFITRRSALMAPRRAFDSDDQFHAFFRAAQALRGAAEVREPRNLAKSVTVE